MKAYLAHAKRGIAVIGGNLANFGLTLARNKLLALTFGPSGVGIIALLNNINETGAVVSGTGICDAYNRELARNRTNHSVKDIVSSGLGIFALLLLLVIPAVLITYALSINLSGITLLIGFGLVVSSVTAGLWRLISGIFLGLGYSLKMFWSVVTAAVVNLIVTAILLRTGVRDPIMFVATTPLVLALIGIVVLRRQLPYLIDWRAIVQMPARRPILVIALPIILGLLMEPLTALYLRWVATSRFGETGVGLMQPGMQLALLGSSLWNSFLGMTIVRWDQSQQKAFSPKSLALIAAAVTIPLLAFSLVFLLRPFWPVLVRLLFSDDFLPGVETVPWFLAGESCRMAGIMMNHTFLSRGMGLMTLLPRVAGLATMVFALNNGWQASILAISQAYTLSYGAYFLVSIALWCGYQLKLTNNNNVHSDKL